MRTDDLFAGPPGAHGSGATGPLPSRAEADPSEVMCWREGAVAHLRLNRPAALNAIGLALARRFRQACEWIAEDEDVRVVVLSGEGRAFSVGGDLAALHEDPSVAADLIESLHVGIRLLAELPAPVIASVHGAVAGGGLGLALNCDLCIAAEGTRFTMAYPLVGTSADCGTSWALPRLVGMRRALEIALLSEPIDATEALRLGLVNRVVSSERLAAETQSVAARLAEGPAFALRSLKRLLRDAEGRSLAQQLDAEAASFLACTTTFDFMEGVSAFLQKRKAAFRGE